MKVYENLIIFDSSDWSEGLIPEFGNGEVFGKPYGLIFSQNLDPERVPGYCSPGFEKETPSAGGTAISGTIVSGIAKSASKAYLGATDGEIHELTITTHAITNAGAFPHAIAAAGAHTGHVTFVCDDIISYQHNVGGTLTTSMFYSYTDNTDWGVGKFNFNATFDDDYMSSVPATPLGTTAADLTGGVGLPHPMVVGADGILYMGSGRYIHGYDGENGADGAFESQVLDLEQGWIITSFLATESYLMAFAYRLPSSGASVGDAKAETRVFYWDYISPTFTRSEDLEDNYVIGAHFYRGIPACFTWGRTGYGKKRCKHRLLSGGRWEATFGLPDYPVNRGVDTVGNRLYVETGGVLYAYGSNDRDMPQGALQSVSQLTGSTRGMVRSFVNDDIVVSSGSNLDRLASGYGQGNFQTNVVQLLVGPGEKRRIEYVRTYFRKAATGGRELSLLLDTDSLTVEKTFFTSEDVTDLAVDAYEDTSGNRFPEFENIQLRASWGAGSGSTDAPVPYRVEIHLKPRKMIKQQ